MIRAVVDTNVLVSGLISPLGNEALIILAIHQGRLRPYFTEAIVAEYTEVLARPKFSFPPDEVAALIARFRRVGEVFNSEAASAASPDPDDTKFLQCAQAAEADFIVTGNKRHFPNTPYGATHVVNAGELLAQITLDL